MDLTDRYDRYGVFHQTCNLLSNNQYQCSNNAVPTVTQPQAFQINISSFNARFFSPSFEYHKNNSRFQNSQSPDICDGSTPLPGLMNIVFDSQFITNANFRSNQNLNNSDTFPHESVTQSNNTSFDKSCPSPQSRCSQFDISKTYDSIKDSNVRETPQSKNLRSSTEDTVIFDLHIFKKKRWKRKMQLVDIPLGAAATYNKAGNWEILTKFLKNTLPLLLHYELRLNNRTNTLHLKINESNLKTKNGSLNTNHIIIKIIHQFISRSDSERKQMYLIYDNSIRIILEKLSQQFRYLNNINEDPLKLYETLTKLKTDINKGNNCKLEKIQQNLIMALYKANCGEDDSLKNLINIYLYLINPKMRQNRNSILKGNMFLEFLYHFNNIFVPYEPATLSKWIEQYKTNLSNNTLGQFNDKLKKIYESIKEYDCAKTTSKEMSLEMSRMESIKNVYKFIENKKDSVWLVLTPNHLAVKSGNKITEVSDKFTLSAENSIHLDVKECLSELLREMKPEEESVHQEIYKKLVLLKEDLLCKMLNDEIKSEKNEKIKIKNTIAHLRKGIYDTLENKNYYLHFLAYELGTKYATQQIIKEIEVIKLLLGLEFYKGKEGKLLRCLDGYTKLNFSEISSSLKQNRKRQACQDLENPPSKKKKSDGVTNSEACHEFENYSMVESEKYHENLIIFELCNYQNLTDEKMNQLRNNLIYVPISAAAVSNTAATNWEILQCFLKKVLSYKDHFLLILYQNTNTLCLKRNSNEHIGTPTMTKIIHKFMTRSSCERVKMYLSWKDSVSPIDLAKQLNEKLYALTNLKEDPVKLYEALTQYKSGILKLNNFELEKIQQNMVMTLYAADCGEDNSLKILMKIHRDFMVKISNECVSIGLEYKSHLEYLYHFNNVFVPYEPVNLSKWIKKYQNDLQTSTRNLCETIKKISKSLEKSKEKFEKWTFFSNIAQNYVANKDDSIWLILSSHLTKNDETQINVETNLIEESKNYTLIAKNLSRLDLEQCRFELLKKMKPKIDKSVYKATQEKLLLLKNELIDKMSKGKKECEKARKFDILKMITTLRKCIFNALEAENHYLHKLAYELGNKFKTTEKIEEIELIKLEVGLEMYMTGHYNQQYH